MPIGIFGEVVGTTGSLDGMPESVKNYPSKVTAPKNPKALRGEKDDQNLTPSQYIFQMSLNTEQKLATMHEMRWPRKQKLLDMGDTSYQKDNVLLMDSHRFTEIHIDEAIFQPFPSEIYFQNFKPNEQYEVPLTLKNNDKVPRLVKVIQAETPYFRIISPLNIGHKVSPGLSLTFRIVFLPDENKDYDHEVVVITERERFVLPVKAIGPRAVLDFPDEINFSNSPVNYASKRTILVRNIGNREAKFRVSCQAPWSVEPVTGSLKENENMQFTVEFQPAVLGDQVGSLFVEYDSGELTETKLCGISEEVNIRLDKTTQRLEPTYIGRTSYKQITITNRSDVIANFKWSNFPTQELEEQEKAQLCQAVDRDTKVGADRLLEEVEMDPTLKDKLAILYRTFENRKRNIRADPLVFTDDVVKVEPSQGVLWPNSTIDIYVVFKPQEPITYHRTIYCAMSGRAERIPLNVRGDGCGPKVQLSFEELSLGQIFINSEHSYELVLANKGDIDAIYSITPSSNSSHFAECFQFTPVDGIVTPGSHQAILVTFRSKLLGAFKQKFTVQVDGSNQKLSVTFDGTVVGPMFHFDVPVLNFRTIAFGFPAHLRCTLENTSLIPMQYTLNVPSDVGTGKPWLATDPADDEDSPRSRFVRERGREFDLQPSQGRLAAMSRQEIDITLIPNQIRRYEEELTVSIQGVGRDVMSLPIIAKCIVPDIKVVNQKLQFGRCFLNYEYTQEIELQNNSSVPGKYEVLTQQLAQALTTARKPSAVSWRHPDMESGTSEHTDSVVEDTKLAGASIFYHTPTCKGIIPPHSSVRIPVTMRTTGKEEQECDVLIKIFGSTAPPLVAKLACFAEGPVVNVEPNFINFGLIEVLVDTPKMVTLANESLIRAQFTAQIVRPKSVFRVEPTSGEILPHQSTVLVITATLDDCLEFEDRLDITVTDGHHRSVLLKAKGFGSTIMIEPPLRPQMQVGPFFSNTHIEQMYTLTNRGRRHQQLVWMNEQYPSYLRIKAPKSSGAPGTIGNPIFTLSPVRASLEPGESTQMCLRCFVDRPQRITETLLCHAIIGRQGGKELIKRIELHAEFIQPLVQLSQEVLSFEIDKRPQDVLHTVRQTVTVKNVSILPLNITARLVHPFSLVLTRNELDQAGAASTLTKQHSFLLECDHSSTLTVEFDPAYKDDCHTRILDEVLTLCYEGHPHQDSVKLHSAVHFPNVTFDAEMVDFGCILNYTELVRTVRMTNSSRLPVKYRWSFLVDGGDNGSATFVFHRNVRRLSTDADTGSFQVRFKDVPQAAEQSNDSADEGLGQEASGVDAYAETDADITIILPNGNSARKRTRSRPEVNINPRLQQLLARDSEPIALGVEEIFDIMPLFGELQPGEAEDIQFTFFAHADIACSVKALCAVEGGPVYDLEMRGQASVLQYEFNMQKVNLGSLLYDQTGQAEIVLRNSGTVPFHFVALDLAEADYVLQPGQLAMFPHSGFVEANGEQILQLKFLPGSPAKYLRKFHIQVAHFDPEEIEVRAEAVFASVTLDLPHCDDENGRYYSLLREACHSLNTEWMDDEFDQPVVLEEINDPELRRKYQKRQLELLTGSKPIRQVMLEKYVDDFEVQREVERLAISKFLDEQQRASLARGMSQYTFVSDTAGRQASNAQSTTNTRRSKASQAQSTKSSTVPKRPQFPDYVLDFGSVILGVVKTFVVHATNTGHFPVSFNFDKKALANSGFSVDLQNVRDLPGAPEHETVSFVVICDPRGANLGVGPIQTPATLNIVNGPQINIRLKANVVMPDIRSSCDTVDFDDVKCGECKIITIQLSNPEDVPCEWSVLYDRQLSQSMRRAKKEAKFVPLHLRKQFLEAHLKEQMEEELKGRVFEVMPPAGVMNGKQRINLQIKFMPKEEKSYQEKLTLRVAQSSTRCVVVCRGRGEEPRLEFDPVSLEFGPTLPHCTSEDKTIVVRNPCKFPIEFYNLEFDKQYLEEEKILRILPGYDEYKSLLLPPRAPSENLPSDIVEFYEDQLQRCRDLEIISPGVGVQSQNSHATDAVEMQSTSALPVDQLSVAHTVATGNKPLPSTSPSHGGTQRDSRDRDSYAGDRDALNAHSLAHSTQRDGIASAFGGAPRSSTPSAALDSRSVVGELEVTPVTAAIARYLGIDLSADGRAAQNRRGIAIIVHGYPQTGKTPTSILLARRYNAALLTIDQIVIEAIANSHSPAATKARDLCIEAATKFAEQQRQLANEAATLQAEPDGLTTEDSVLKKPSHAQKPKLDKPSAKHGKDHVKANPENADDVQAVKLAPPVARKLSVAIAAEDGIMSTVLPEQLVIDLIAERLQLSDCLKGVVFDSLDTLFCANSLMAFQCVLRALNNRKHIYLIYLKQDYPQLKERERVEKEDQAQKALAAAEEEQRRLEEMSEDEYAALPQEQRELIDARQLKLKKERLRREAERKLEQARIREQQEMEARRLEEERLRKRGKKLPPPAQQKGAAKLGAKELSGGAQPTSRSTVPPGPNQSGAMSERADSHTSPERPDQSANEERRKRAKDGKRSKTDEDFVDDEHTAELEAELKAQQKFKLLEYELKLATDVAQFWDRTGLQIKRATTPPEGADHEDGHGGGKKAQKAAKAAAEKEDKKDKEKVGHEKERIPRSKDSVVDVKLVVDNDQAPGPVVEAKPVDLLAPIAPAVFWPAEDNPVGLPYIVLDCTDRDRHPLFQIMSLNKLPMPNEVLDGIGIGPNGPPIPPPAMFSVVNFPEKRGAPVMDRFEYYSFVAASPDDPNLQPLTRIKEPEEESIAEKDRKLQDRLTPTKTAGKKSSSDKKDKEKEKEKEKEKADKEKADKDKGRSRSPPASRRSGVVNETSREPRPTQREPQRGSAEVPTHNEGEPFVPQKLQRFRWTVPAGGEVKICVRFYSEEVGHIDQTFNFELLGTRKRYQLLCRGMCSFPIITKEPHVLFRNRKRTKLPSEIVSKKFILASETYEFGPLLAGKSRDRFKERYPENMEKITISNTSPLSADISFCFYQDSRSDTFILDPPTMTLASGETQQLSIWAYPKVPGRYEDTLVCCIRENPEPVLIKLACDGVRPEVQLDNKVVNFDKVLLHRKETRTIYMRNPTLLPVSWKAAGVDALGEDFTVSHEQGIIDPKSEFALQVHYRAMKPTKVNPKKGFRIEVYDVENIMGIVQSETIQVLAEAYDIALDLSFQKGETGGIDFHTVRAFDDARQSIVLKNRGTYDIEYRFEIESKIPGSKDHSVRDLHSYFAIQPIRGTLAANDRSTNVSVLFKCDRDLEIVDQPLVKVYVIEPSMSQGKETVACIPIRISVKSVFSRYQITPSNDINFGFVTINTRKSRTFTIENKGEFEFKYIIQKFSPRSVEANALTLANGSAKPKLSTAKDRTAATLTQEATTSSTAPQATAPADTRTLTNTTRQVGGTSLALIQSQNAIFGQFAMKRVEARQDQPLQQKLQLGMFTIYPAYGVIAPGQTTTIIVDCIAETAGRSDELLGIEVTDRNPADNPDGIPYKLFVESCIPCINTMDLSTIFEEHRVCKNLLVWQQYKNLKLSVIGVFAEEENRYVFENVLIGARSMARFKISNANKVPCDVICVLRPTRIKSAAGFTPSNKAAVQSVLPIDVFEIEPQRLSIPAHAHQFVTVTFAPTALHSYSALFEAAVDNLPANVPKPKNIQFDLFGEGTLPRVCIMKPTLRNKRGQHLLQFRKLLLGRSEPLPLVLLNDGTLPCKVDIDLIDPDMSFSLQPADADSASRKALLRTAGVRIAHTASILLEIGEQIEFEVVFRPLVSRYSQAQLQITVVNNQYEDTIVQLVGEGYEDDVVFENINRVVLPSYYVIPDPETLLSHPNTPPLPIPLQQQQQPPGSSQQHQPPGSSQQHQTPASSQQHQPPGSSQQHQTPASSQQQHQPPASSLQHQTPASSQQQQLPAPSQLQQSVPPPSTTLPLGTTAAPSVAGAGFGATQNAEDAALLASLEEEAAAAKSNHLFFGDCRVKDQVTQCFTMLNRGANCVRFQFPDNDAHFKFSPTLGHLHAGCSKDIKVTFTSDVPFTTIEQALFCKVVQIVFDGGADSVAEWDDRQQVVKWVDILQRADDLPDPIDPSASIATTRIGKRKQIVAEPEPRYTELPDTVRSLELLVSVNCCFAKYECSVDKILLKDTPLLETLVYKFSLTNVGDIVMDYNWGLQLTDSPNNALTPFTFEPSRGQVFPGSNESFTLKFAPLDAGIYNAKLICTVPNADPVLQSMFEMPIRARAVLPYVHFDLDESDYITAGRRPVNLRGPGGLPPGTRLDPATRCIEFQAIGLSERIRKSFTVINPTSQTYTFEWKEDVDENEVNNVKQKRAFTCSQTSAKLDGGRKQLVTFEYHPGQFGATESFWQFNIPELQLSVPFLLVGEAHEPLVTFDRAHLRFKPLLVGHEATETVYLINSEPTEFQFEFVPTSLMAPGEGVNLKVSPKMGTIGPQSRLPVEIRFKPNSDKELCFKVACKVKNKPQPVTINVKCEGYKIDCDLMVETSEAQWLSLALQSQNLLEPAKDGVQYEVTEFQLAPVDFGEVELHEDCAKQLAIVNLGKFNFDFHWEIRPLPGVKKSLENLMRQYVRFEPDRGYVKVEERFLCNVFFKPLTKINFASLFKIEMHVASGPVYSTLLLGSVVEPQVQFSWTEWDFGACYIYKPGMPVQQCMLEIRNTDTKPVSVHSLYKPSAQLRVLFEPTVMSPGQVVTVPIQFYPKEPVKYQEVVQFELNSLTKHDIVINGQGVDLKVETVSTAHRLVDFGAMRIGSAYKKTIPIVNNSPAPATFKLVCTPASDLKDEAACGFSWHPQGELTLKPHEKTKVEVSISPKRRMVQFCEEMVVECFSNSMPVFAIQGSCHGTELQLETSAIAFGAVAQRCQLTRKLIMNNTGDIGAAFRWDADRFKPDFSIEPVQGYLAPGMQVVFDVTFTPQELANDIRYSNLKCFVEGSNPLLLTLTGMCVAVQPLKETLSFSTTVRNKEVKGLQLINRTNQLWTLKPVIEGPFWTGAETFVVEPMQTKLYELTYRPLAMTLDGKRHSGSVFFALPDGTGLMYHLIGQADPPKPINKIMREIPSKVHYTELLQVFNWLKKPQRFRVKIDLIKPDKLDVGTIIKGLDYVDIPGDAKRDYKLTFFAFKESILQFKVTFVNEQTGEFQFYELAFKTGRPAAIQSLVLTTTVRQSALGSIKLENPLAQQITFLCTCSSAEVLMPYQFIIPANSEGTFNFEYFALRAGETQAKLELTCNELGIFSYDLLLKALPGGVEPTLHFNTPLGTSHILSARFVHYARQKVDYSCKVDNPEFHVDKLVTAAPVGAGGAEISVDVSYEPSIIGEARGTLTISNIIGGEYHFPLIGVCTPPKPQGPFVVKAGSTTAISLRNVFSQPTTYLFQVDNPAFHLPKNTETIKPKKEYKLMVAFDGTASGEKGFVMAKLLVTCARSTGQSASTGQAQNVQWVYYLKGVAQ